MNEYKAIIFYSNDLEKEFYGLLDKKYKNTFRLVSTANLSRFGIRSELNKIAPKAHVFLMTDGKSAFKSGIPETEFEACEKKYREYTFRKINEEPSLIDCLYRGDNDAIKRLYPITDNRYVQCMKYYEGGSIPIHTVKYFVEGLDIEKILLHTENQEVFKDLNAFLETIQK
jgi:hypothetical protein